MPLGQQRTTKGLPANWLSLDAAYSQREQTSRRILDAYAYEQWAQDIENCVGLLYAYKGGVVDAVAETRVADGTVLLDDDAVNYVERDSAGAVTANVSGFTLGSSAMAIVTTRLGAIVDVVDWRTSDGSGGGGGGGAIDAGDIVTGILPAARGGTDNGEPDFGDLLVGGPANAWLRIGAVVGGAVLMSAGVGSPALPTWGQIANAHVAAAAAIEWIKIDKTGSSLADLATRSASDLSSGNLAYARMPTGGGTWANGGTLSITGGVTTVAGLDSTSSIRLSNNQFLQSFNLGVGTGSLLGVNGSLNILLGDIDNAFGQLLVYSGGGSRASFTTTELRPASAGAYALGSAAVRWGTLYGTVGDFNSTVTATEFIGPSLDSGSATDLLLQRNNVTRMTLGQNNFGFGLSPNAAIGFNLAATTAGVTTHSGIDFTHNVGADATSAAVLQYQALAQGSLSDLYNIRILDSVGAGTITTQYGLYVASLAEGLTNYAIYTNSGLVRFGDAVTSTSTMTATEFIGVSLDSGAASDLVLQRNNSTILTLGAADITPTVRLLTIASGTGSSGFRLPHGTAPTVPVNGDFWTTTAGAFIRIDGTTYQLVTVAA